ILAQNERILIEAGSLIKESAGVRDSKAVEYADRAFYSLLPPVNRVVVGRHKHIKAHIFQRNGQLVGRTELRVALVRRACEGYFEVSERNIRALDIGPHAFKTGSIVIGFCFRVERRSDLTIVPHNITGEKQRNPCRILCEGGRRIEGDEQQKVFHTLKKFIPG